MFTAVCRLSRTDALFVEVPALVGALGIAEGLYKFHSFILEGMAFLVTWFVLGGVMAAGRRVLGDRSVP